MRINIDLGATPEETEEQRAARALAEANKTLGIDTPVEETPVAESASEEQEAIAPETPWARVETVTNGNQEQVVIYPMRPMEDGTLLYANGQVPQFNLRTHIIALNSVLEYMASAAEFYPMLKKHDSLIGNTYRHMLDSCATSVSEALIILNAPSDKFPTFEEPEDTEEDYALSEEEDEFVRVQNTSVDSNTFYVNQEVVHSILDSVLEEGAVEASSNPAEDTANVINLIRSRLEEAVGDRDNVTGDLFISASNGLGQASIGSIISKAGHRLRTSAQLANNLAWYNTSLGANFLGFVSGLNAELNAISVALGTGSLPPIGLEFSPIQPPTPAVVRDADDDMTFVQAPQIHAALDEAAAAPTIVSSREELIERIRTRIFSSDNVQTLDLFEEPREGVSIPMGMNAELSESGDVNLIITHGLRFPRQKTTPEGTVILGGKTLLIADELDDSYVEDLVMSFPETDPAASSSEVLLIANGFTDDFLDEMEKAYAGRIVCLELTPNSDTDCERLQSVLGGQVFDVDNFPLDLFKDGRLGKFHRAEINDRECKIQL